MSVATPLLEKGDARALADAVKARWSSRDLCFMLLYSEVDVRRVAAMALGLIGEQKNVRCLVEALKDTDSQVNQMAEYALWSVWFRSCRKEAAEPFRKGIALLGEEKYGEAIAHFNHAFEIDNRFAEAHHQAAIAYYLLGRYEKSIRRCQQTLEINPDHFGALASMGHAHVQLGNVEMALVCYRHVLDVNPASEDIRRAAERMEKKLSERNEDSGVFRVDINVA